MYIRTLGIHSTLLIVVIGITLFISTFAQTASASHSVVTVTRGPQAPMVQLWWNVVGGSGTCFGTTNYPSISDAVRTSWNVTHSSVGGISWAAVNAPPGNYTFTCTDSMSGVSDFATMTVNDCTGGLVWSSVSNTCVASPPAISSFTNNGPIANNTSAILTYSVSGATNCSIDNGIGMVNASGGTVGTPNLVSNTTYTLTCSNGNGSDSRPTTVTVNLASAPVVTVTPNTASGGGTGSAYFGEQGNLSWVGTNSPTSCTIYRNGATVVGTYPYPGTISYTTPAITGSESYRAECTNGVNGIGNTVIFSLPPPQTNPGHICDAGGTSVDTTWIMPSGYNDNYVRLLDNVTSVVTYINNGTGNSHTFSPIVSGRSYTWWAHTRVSNSNYSAAIGETFTCNLGAGPAVTLSACNLGGGGCVTNPGTKTINAGDEVQITWDSPTATGGCTAIAGAGFAASGIIGTDNTITEPSAGNSDIFTVRCSNGAGDTDASVTVSTSAGATPPATNAGIDRAITLPTSSVQPSGASAVDSDGIASTVWSVVSGPVAATIANSTTLTPTFTNMTVSGTYVFRLTATDSLGASSVDTMQVVVSAVPPTITRFVICDLGMDDASCVSSKNVPPGTQATIRWNSSNTDSCSGSGPGFTTGTLPNGSANVSASAFASQSRSFGINCEKGGVPAWPPSPVTLNTNAVTPDISTNNTMAKLNGPPVTISWNTNGNDPAACTLSGGTLPPTISAMTGNSSQAISGRTTFRINCGGIQDSVTVDVIPDGGET